MDSMTFAHSKYILPLIHSFIHSSSLAYGKRKLFPLCIYMSKTERREQSVKSAY